MASADPSQIRPPPFSQGQAQHLTPHRDAFAAGRDVNVTVGGPAASGVRGRGLLWPPLGRLPAQVRGRDPLLNRLTALLHTPDGRAHVLGGLGGIGKSTIALRLAGVAAELGRPVWWISASDARSMADALLDLAVSLGADQTRAEAARVGRADASDVLWPQLEALQGWLLVIDNADDLGALTVSDRPVRDGNGWVRGSRSGLTIVTSRDTGSAHWGHEVEVHPVGWLPSGDGGQVLLDLAPHGGDRAGAEALSARLGGLPLALHHAGSQLASPFSSIQSFSQYAQALEKALPSLLAPRHDTGDREVVARTWELSLSRLAEVGIPQVRGLLGVLAWFAGAVPLPHADLDREILGKACGDQGVAGVDVGLEALLSVGLVQTRLPGQEGDDRDDRDERVQRGTITLHPLVVEVTRHRLLTEGTAVQAASLTVDLLVAALSGLDADEPADWPSWNRWLPHITDLIHHVSEMLDDAALNALARAAAESARMLVWAGSYHTALHLAEDARKPLQKRLGRKNLLVNELLFRQAIAYQFLGDHAAAEGLYREVLDTYQTVLGADHYSTLSARHQLAWLAAGLGHAAEAERQYREVLRDQERILGPAHPSTLDTRFELARTIAEQGNAVEAELLYREVLSDQERVLGSDDPSILVTRHAVADSVARQERTAEAERLFREVLLTQNRVLGETHPFTLDTRYEIARLMAHRGDLEGAALLLREVHGVRARVLGTGHPATRAARRALEELGDAEGGGSAFGE